MRLFGFETEFVDDYYDYLVEGIPVEVKSCRMTIKAWRKDSETPYYRVGRFDFTDKENREKLRGMGGWIALLVRHHKQFLFLGFIDSGSLNGARYISIHKARNYNPITFREWMKQIGDTNE